MFIRKIDGYGACDQFFNDLCGPPEMRLAYEHKKESKLILPIKLAYDPIQILRI